MGSCCEDDGSIEALREKQRGTLQIVLGTNLVMFIVIAAAAAVWLTGEGWPDIVIAAGLVLLLLRSSIRVISSAVGELRGAA